MSKKSKDIRPTRTRELCRILEVRCFRWQEGTLLYSQSSYSHQLMAAVSLPHPKHRIILCTFLYMISAADSEDHADDLKGHAVTKTERKVPVRSGTYAYMVYKQILTCLDISCNGTCVADYLRPTRQPLNEQNCGSSGHCASHQTRTACPIK